MDRGAWHYPTGDVRASDADRDRALSELGEARQAGRITADEYDERSAQALAARTGKDLTALLADLPVQRVPETRTAAVDRAQLARAARVAAVAALAAFCFTAVAAAGALLSLSGPTLQQRELAQALAASPGMPPPPNPGFDWPGVITPAAIAVLLVGLVIYLRVCLARDDHVRGQVRG
jgi:Domain of unknown function (DUF1707)